MLPPWLRSSVATAVTSVSAAAASSCREEAAVKVAKVFTILAPPAQPLLQRRNITSRASSSSHRRGVHLDTTSPSPSYEHWPPPSSSQHASSSSSSHFTFPPSSPSQRNRHLLRYLDEDVDVDGHFASFSTLEERHQHQHQLPTAPKRGQQHHHLDSLPDSDLVAYAEQMGRDQLPEEASKLLDYLCGDMRLQQSGGSHAHGGHAASARLLQTWRRGGDSVTRRRRAAQALLRGAAAADLTSDEGKEPAEGITTLLSPHEVLRVFSILEEQPSAGEPTRGATSSTQEDPPPPPPPFSFLSPHSGQRLASKLLHSGHPTLFPVFVALFEDLQSRRSAQDQDAGLGQDEELYPTTDIMIDAFLYALHPRVWGQQGGDSFARRAVNALLLQGQQRQQQAGGKGAREMAQLRGAGKDTRAWSSALAADEANAAMALGSKDVLIFELFTRLLVVRLCLQEGRLDATIIKEQLREIVAAPARYLRRSSSSSGHAEQAGLDARAPTATEALSAQYLLDTINNVLAHGHGSKSKLAVRLASDLVGEHAALVAMQAASLAASNSHNLLIESEQDTLLEELCQRALDIKRPGSAIRALRAVKQASASASAPSSFSLSTLLRPDTLIGLISSHRLVERAGFAPSHLHELLGWDQTSNATVTEPLVPDLSPSLRPALLRALAFARVKGPLAYLWMRWTDAGQDQPSITASGGVLGAHTIAADTALMKLLVKTFAPSRSALSALEAKASMSSQELLHPDEGQRSSVSLPLRTRGDEMAFATHVLQAFHRARTSPAEEPLFPSTISTTSTISPDPDTTTDPSPSSTPSSSTTEEQALSHPQLYDHYDLTTLASAYLDLGREKAAFKLFGELLHRREVPDETDLLVLVYAVATRASRKQQGRAGKDATGARKGVQEAYKLYERYCMPTKPLSGKRRGEEPSPPAPAGVHKQLRPTPKLHATLLRLALRAGEIDIARNLALSARKLRFLGGGGGDGENVAGGHGGGGGRGDTQTATTLLLASRAFSPMSFEQQQEGAAATGTGITAATPPHVRPVWYGLAKLAQSKVRDRSWQPDAELLQHFARAALRGHTSLCSSPTTNPSTTPTRRPRPTDNSLRSSLIFLQLASLQTRNIDSTLVEEALVCLQHRARSLANSRRDRSSRGEWGRVVDAFVGGCLRRVEVGRGGVWRRVGEEVTARDEREEHEEEEEVDEAPFDHDADADADAESNVEPVDVQPVTPRASSSSSSSTSPSPPTTTPSPSHPLINTLTLRLLAGIYTELRDRSGAYQVALWLRDRHRQRTAAAPPPPYSHAEWSSLSEARQAVALLGRGLRLRLASQARSEKALLEGPRRIEEDSRQDEEEVAGTEEVRRGDAWERERPARRARATRGRQEQPQQEVRDDRNAVGNVDVDVDADAELDRWAEEEQHTRDKPWWKRERWDV